eukprot:COSAG01_NODE_13481_length_1579_cov_9.465541_1_plen_107_part_10
MQQQPMQQAAHHLPPAIQVEPGGCGGVLRSATARPPRSPGNQSGGSCMVMTQADRLKWIALALLVFQNGITPLILRFAMSEASSKDRFDTGQAVLVQEAMKVGLSIV